MAEEDLSNLTAEAKYHCERCFLFCSGILIAPRHLLPTYSCGQTRFDISIVTGAW